MTEESGKRGRSPDFLTFDAEAERAPEAKTARLEGEEARRSAGRFGEGPMQ